MEILNLFKHVASSFAVDSEELTGNLEIDLQLKSDGCAVIPNFLSKDRCRELISSAAQIIMDAPDKVIQDYSGSDCRVYGIEVLDEKFNLLDESKIIDDWAGKFYRTQNPEFFQLLGRTQYKEGNLGSGGGWHRDSPFSHQFKFILYLSDVSDANGPFQYITKTHTTSSILKFSRACKLSCGQFRFSEDNIAEIINSLDTSEVRTITGGAGTLLIANVKGIHRGMPLKSGERWATTRYYFKKHVPNHLMKLLPRQ